VDLVNLEAKPPFINTQTDIVEKAFGSLQNAAVKVVKVADD